jgi:hypothetical protein
MKRSKDLLKSGVAPYAVLECERCEARMAWGIMMKAGNQFRHLVIQ